MVPKRTVPPRFGAVSGQGGFVGYCFINAATFDTGCSAGLALSAALPPEGAGPEGAAAGAVEPHAAITVASRKTPANALVLVNHVAIIDPFLYALPFPSYLQYDLMIHIRCMPCPWDRRKGEA